MNFKRKAYENDMEILATDANLVAFTGTISALDVKADENGRKYVVSGSLVDSDGKLVTQSGSAGAETLSATPIGILYKTVDVTDGDQPGALVVEGYLRTDRVLDGFTGKAITAIKTALPNIKFR